MKKLFVAILLIGFLFSLSADEPQKPLKFSRTKTEIVALSIAGGNYGIGANIAFATLRRQKFYWEIIRLQMNFARDRTSINGKTMVGIPLFLTKNSRHELRFGIGLSGGVSVIKTHTFSNNGGGEQVFWSFLNLPVETSYIFHISKNLALQIGISLDFPMFFINRSFGSSSGDTNRYYPILSGFIGFRF